METVSIRIEEGFSREIVRAMKMHHFMTKTEFIRQAIRDKLKELETAAAVARLDALHGTSRRKTSDVQRERAGELAVDDLERSV